MIDDRLRELERRWKESGAVEDEAAYLLARVRIGELEPRRLALAVYLGDPAAMATGVAAWDEEGVPDWAVKNKPRMALCWGLRWPEEARISVLAACRAARRVLLPSADQRLFAALDSIERFASGEDVPVAELRAAADGARAAARAASWAGGAAWAARAAVWTAEAAWAASTERSAAWAAALGAVCTAEAVWARAAAPDAEAERAAQAADLCALLLGRPLPGMPTPDAWPIAMTNKPEPAVAGHEGVDDVHFLRTGHQREQYPDFLSAG